MPITKANRARYPAEWPAIRAAVLERAGHCCEHPGCGLRNYSIGAWKRGAGGEHVFHRLAGNGPCDAAGDGLDWPSLDPLTFAQARQIAAEADDPEDQKLIVIVLTIAHLDHTPEHCDLNNLRAWCQRHHLAYDVEHHKVSCHMTRRAKLGNLELPLEPAA